MPHFWNIVFSYANEKIFILLEDLAGLITEHNTLREEDIHSDPEIDSWINDELANVPGG